jgi:hypothetical protein
LRDRIGSAAAAGPATSVAGPIYAAFGGQSAPTATSAQAGRIMK